MFTFFWPTSGTSFITEEFLPFSCFFRLCNRFSDQSNFHNRMPPTRKPEPFDLAHRFLEGTGRREYFPFFTRLFLLKISI